MNQKKDQLPKISIVIPVLNKAPYIKETLQSIADQNYPNLEVIIQDGGSTDGSVEIIKEFYRKKPAIFSWVSKKDGGQVDAINKGLNKARGEIVAFINADDVYKANSLMAVGNYFKSHPETLWLTGYGDIIDQNGNLISGWVTKYKNYLLKLNRYQMLLAVNYITQPATFLSANGYKKYGSASN